MTIPIEQLQAEYINLKKQVEWLTSTLQIQSTVLAGLLQSSSQGVSNLSDYVPLKQARVVKGMPSPETLRAWILEDRMTEYINDIETPNAHYKRHGGKGFILINCEAILRDLNQLAKRKLNHQ